MAIDSVSQLTYSTMMKATNKRELLIKAAASRFHRFGLSASSIAEVANDAGIPPGNVYYYFRTKDSLATAVQDHWQTRTDAALAEIDAGHPDAPSRLVAFLDRSEGNASFYAEAGCPIAVLSRDCRGGSDLLRPLAGRNFEKQAEWLERQFAEIGLSQRERLSAAWAILTAIQGGIALAYVTQSETPFRAAIADARQRVLDLVADFPRAKG